MHWEIMKMAFESLFSNKTRSFLSMLGIIIGVSTVIAVFAIGRGAQDSVSEQFQNLSANSIIIMSARGRESTGSSKLKVEDANVILEKAEHIGEASTSVRGEATVSFEKDSSSFSIIGNDEKFFDVANLVINSGTLFSVEDVNSKNNVAVIGNGVAETLFTKNQNPVRNTITVNNKKVEVVGVLKELGSNTGPMSYDDSVFMPYTSAEKSILGGRAMLTITVLVDSVDNVELATESITSVLRQEHKLKSTQEDDFSIMDAGSMVGTAQESAELMTILLIAIAAITLLVSGIGIMNVMFVTVAERTKEIGIARAIGGKQSDILLQFLLESIILSTIGGIIGIIIGQSAIWILSHFDFIDLASSIEGPIIGFSFSVVVGVIFGFYPAYKASRLDPVDSLRSE